MLRYAIQVLIDVTELKLCLRPRMAMNLGFLALPSSFATTS
jgi:hypothetical protein